MQLLHRVSGQDPLLLLYPLIAVLNSPRGANFSSFEQLWDATCQGGSAGIRLPLSCRPHHSWLRGVTRRYFTPGTLSPSVCTAFYMARRTVQSNTAFHGATR
eukprot:gene9513-biopygen5160